jgi:excisionase family DNA binding protein
MIKNVTSENTKTLTVPEAGSRYFGLSRGASYAAAANGQLPTIRIGRLLRVPVVALERLLERAAEARG